MADPIKHKKNLARTCLVWITHVEGQRIGRWTLETLETLDVGHWMLGVGRWT